MENKAFLDAILGDSDTLTAASIELMRIGVHQSTGETYHVHDLAYTLLDSFLVISAVNLLHDQRCRDRLTDRHTRIQ